MNSVFKILLFVAAVSMVYCGAVPAKKSSQIVHPFFSSAVRLPGNKQIRSLSGEPCDENQFNYCTQKFAAAMNLTAMPDDATSFFYYMIGMVINKGLPGFEGICKATDDYVACLGQTFDTCLSVENLVSIGLDENDATVYASLAPQLKYECGPAYEVFVDHFDCALADLKTKTYQIIACIQTFNSSIVTDPANTCIYVQSFVNCYDNIFTNCGEDFTDALCESMKVSFAVSLPQCTLDCSSQKRIAEIKKNFDLLKIIKTK